MIRDVSIESAKFFPNHGWVESSEGIRHLRFPILQLFTRDSILFERYASLKLSGIWLQFHSPHRTLRLLATALRDLHKQVRISSKLRNENWYDKPPRLERDIALNRLTDAEERAEVLLIAALILLRRLPDDIIAASLPILFDKFGSAPQNFKELIKLAQNNTLSKLQPRCNLLLLTTLLTTGHDWFDKLRSNGGLRDTIVHYPHNFGMTAAGTSKGTGEVQWRVTAEIMTLSKNNNIKSYDALPILIECLRGASTFMKDFYCCFELNDTYKSDCMFLKGLDNDSVGFWPSISDGITNFPLFD